jgi:hypothetical protein
MPPVPAGQSATGQVLPGVRDPACSPMRELRDTASRGAKFCFECAKPVSGFDSTPRLVSPDFYTPKHLAERILTSKAALEGERKQVTVLFADLKGSMACRASRPTISAWTAATSC